MARTNGGFDRGFYLYVTWRYGQLLFKYQAGMRQLDGDQHRRYYAVKKLVDHFRLLANGEECEDCLGCVITKAVPFNEM